MDLNPRMLLVVLLLATFAGCTGIQTRPPPVKGAVLNHLTVEQYNRSFWLYATGDATRPRPLLVVLHEARSNGDAMIRLGHFGEDAASKGYLLAAPNLANGGPDETAFISSMIDKIRGKYPVSAVYAVGYGTGGKMALRLALTIPGKLNGVASVAGLISPPPQRDWKGDAPTLPVMIMVGDKDPMLPGNDAGKQSGGTAPADTIREWARYFGCSTSVTASARMIRQTGWYGCRDKVTIALVAISGLGHHWPGGNRADEVHRAGQTPGPYVSNVDATDIIWDFFTRIAPRNQR